MKHGREKNLLTTFSRASLPSPSELKKYVFRAAICKETTHKDQNLCTLCEDFLFNPGPEWEGL